MQCAEKLTDPWVRQKLDALRHDNEACVRAYAQATQDAEAVHRLRRFRRAAQRAVDRHTSRRPTGWRWWRRRAWEDEHERRRSQLRKTMREEQEALGGTPSAVHQALANRVRVLREGVTAFEVLAAPKPPEVVVKDGAQVVRDPAQLVKDIERLRAERRPHVRMGVQ